MLCVAALCRNHRTNTLTHRPDYAGSFFSRRCAPHLYHAVSQLAIFAGAIGYYLSFFFMKNQK
ncbi:hypothetical protein GQ54DRAFT_301057 [Martensiomyces pterosporus]|nr:hypothetical protein GQ54DRAFT_301057 [Martensiomyces pterosporus]